MSFRVTITGQSLKEFQKNLRDYVALTDGGKTTLASEKEVHMIDSFKEVDEDGDEMEEVASPYASTVSQTSNVAEDNSDVDAEGLPWDARIHSSSKMKIASGVWKKKKGVDQAVINQVKKELLSSSTPVVAAAVPAIPSATVTTPAPAVAAAPVAASVPVPSPAAPMPTGGQSVDSFKANFPMIVGNLIAEGKLKQEYVEGTLKPHYGITEIWQATDVQRAEMFESFASWGLITKVG